jgi:hypothetical protein
VAEIGMGPLLVPSSLVCLTEWYNWWAEGILGEAGVFPIDPMSRRDGSFCLLGMGVGAG